MEIKKLNLNELDEPTTYKKYVPKQIESLKNGIIEKILLDTTVSSMRRFFNLRKEYNFEPIQLVGGAIIDLINGKKPKDYDFISYEPNFSHILHEMGFNFSYETEWARTYTRMGIVVQVLKRNIWEFDFTIAQSAYNLVNGELTIDVDSFISKKLIPVTYHDKVQVLDAISRVDHWRKKGFTIDNRTLKAMYRHATPNNTNNVIIGGMS